VSLFKKTLNKVDVSRPPRVNFVPDGFADDELDVIVRRRLFYLVNGVFVLCALAYLGTTVTAFSADVFLKNSQLRLDEMRARQEILREISVEEAHIKFLQAAKVVGSSSEVMWTPLIQSIVDTYPAGTATNSIDILPIGNLAIGPASSTPKDAVVQVNLFLLMDNYNSIQTWMNNLATIPGYSDSKLSSISSNGGTYEVKLAVFFNHEVLAKRNMAPVTVGEVAD
jgi:hypothetical protein